MVNLTFKGTKKQFILENNLKENFSVNNKNLRIKMIKYLKLMI